jgi:hypothetical protein
MNYLNRKEVTMNHHETGWDASHNPSLPTSRHAAHQERGIFAVLRALVPRRLLNAREIEIIAELQANRLIELAGQPQYPLPTELISELPRVALRLDPELPVSGAAQWSSGRWIISINANEPWRRQRFTLAHELKHVLDHPLVETIYAGDTAAEYAADVFAACLLMPRKELKRVWGDGMQSLGALAECFGVSERAALVRLQRLGLRAPLPRHGDWPPSPPTSARRSGRYERRSATHLVGAE